MSDAPDFTAPKGNGERDGARPRFYVEAVQNNAATAERGQPVFYEREMVHILIPGDRLTEFTSIVKPEHKQRWPQEYAAFKAGQDAPVNGTPIEQLPGITQAQAAELRHSHVLSIESLAGLPDGLLAKAVSMRGLALRDTAKRWLETAAGAAPMEKLAAENAEKDAKIAALETQVADLAKRLDALPAQAVPPAPPEPS